jgi:hypothetical protein
MLSESLFFSSNVSRSSADDIDMALDGLSSQQRQFMLVEGARARVEETSSQSMEAQRAMEGIQNMVGQVLGVIGQLLKGIFSKGGAKGGKGG